MNLPVKNQADAPPDDLFGERYRERRPELSRSLQKVVDYIDRHRVQVLAQSAVEIGSATRTSDATVVRAVQALGFTGLPGLRQALTKHLTGDDSPAGNLRHTLSDVGADAEAAMESVRHDVVGTLQELGSAEVQDRLVHALRLLQGAERIAVFGIGPTAHLAGYLGTRLRRQGRKRLVITQTGRGLADELLELGIGDVVLMMAYGELYGEARAIISQARRIGLPIVLISDSREAELLAAAEVVIPVSRGKNGHFSLHGATLTCLEMLLLGLAVAASPQALSSLAQLSNLRTEVSAASASRDGGKSQTVRQPHKPKGR